MTHSYSVVRVVGLVLLAALVIFGTEYVVTLGLDFIWGHAAAQLGPPIVFFTLAVMAWWKFGRRP